MRGKKKCKILKEIRKRIADENDIPYEIRNCNYQGDCSGTCPKCEGELRWLEYQLKKKEELGQPVKINARNLEDYDVPDKGSNNISDELSDVSVSKPSTETGADSISLKPPSSPEQKDSDMEHVHLLGYLYVKDISYESC